MSCLEAGSIPQPEAAGVSAYPACLHADQECLVVTCIHSIDRRTFNPGGAFGEDGRTGPTRRPCDPLEFVDLIAGQLAKVRCDFPLVRTKHVEAQTAARLGYAERVVELGDADQELNGLDA